MKKIIVCLYLFIGIVCGVSAQKSAAPLSSNISSSKINKPDDFVKDKKYRDRSTYGFYLFGGVTLSTFVGQDVYDWDKSVGLEPGYTIGGGFDLLRLKNGIYFGSETAFTSKGATKDYIAKPSYGEEAASSRIILNYWQVTPLKIGWTFSCNDNFGIGVYTGFGIELLVTGHERESVEGRSTMRSHTDWNGHFDKFIPFNLNFDYKQWSVGLSYDLGLGNVIEGNRNKEISRIHNSCTAVKLIYHFKFKEPKVKEVKKDDKYKRGDY